MIFLLAFRGICFHSRNNIFILPSLSSTYVPAEKNSRKLRALVVSERSVDLEHAHKEPRLCALSGDDARPVWGLQCTAWDIKTRRDTGTDLFSVQCFEVGVSVT